MQGLGVAGSSPEVGVKSDSYSLELGHATGGGSRLGVLQAAAGRAMWGILPYSSSGCRLSLSRSKGPLPGLALSPQLHGS